MADEKDVAPGSLPENPPAKKARGFASMDRARQKEIASKGGRAAHAKGTAHEFNPDEARNAGRKGGVAVSQNREHMARIGGRGGHARGRKDAIAREFRMQSGAISEDAMREPPIAPQHEIRGELVGAQGGQAFSGMIPEAGEQPLRGDRDPAELSERDRVAQAELGEGELRGRSHEPREHAPEGTYAEQKLAAGPQNDDELEEYPAPASLGGEDIRGSELSGDTLTGSEIGQRVDLDKDREAQPEERKHIAAGPQPAPEDAEESRTESRDEQRENARHNERDR